MNVELKNVKNHPDMSQETPCFSATIYLDGKKIGSVQNNGHGGCNSYYWNDHTAAKRLTAWADQQPTEFEFEKLDQIIDDLMNKQEILAQLKRWVKKDTMFRLKGDKKGEWRMVKKHTFAPDVVKFLQGKYPNLEHIADPNNLDAALAFC